MKVKITLHCPNCQSAKYVCVDISCLFLDINNCLIMFNDILWADKGSDNSVEDTRTAENSVGKTKTATLKNLKI
jgi:hypothetical protein